VTSGIHFISQSVFPFASRVVTTEVEKQHTANMTALLVSLINCAFIELMMSVEDNARIIHAVTSDLTCAHYKVNGSSNKTVMKMRR
jgi:hypothetical protein